jgi:hypothetical protein
MSCMIPAQGDDGSGTLCRLWDTKSRKRVFAEALLIDSLKESCCPQRVRIVSGQTSAESAGLVVQFGPHQGAASKTTPHQVPPDWLLDPQPHVTSTSISIIIEFSIYVIYVVVKPQLNPSSQR